MTARIPEQPVLPQLTGDAAPLANPLTQTLGEIAREVNLTLPEDQAEAFSMFWGLFEVGAGVAPLITAEGEIIVGDSSGDADALAIGTDGQVLTSDGTTAAWETPAAKVLQVVNVMDGAVATGTTVLLPDDTVPQNTEGDEYMTLAITPTATDSKLKIEVVFNAAANIITTMSVALFQDSTAGALAAVGGVTALANVVENVTFTHFMTAGTTSATTFKVRAGPAATGTLTFNGGSATRRYGGVYASSITITEIAA